MENYSNTIIRTNKRENPYVMIDKYGLNDERLSWKAKGLLAYLLSKPDDWQIYEAELIKRSKDGRDAVRTALRELEKYGYMSRRQLRKEDGSFGVMEYIVYERPVMPEDPADGKSVYGESEPQTENPSTGNPRTENPLLLSNDLTKNDLTKDDDDTLHAFEHVIEKLKSLPGFTLGIFNTVTKRMPARKTISDIEAYITEAVQREIAKNETRAARQQMAVASTAELKHRSKPQPFVSKQNSDAPLSEDELAKIRALARKIQESPLHAASDPDE